MKSTVLLTAALMLLEGIATAQTAVNRGANQIVQPVATEPTPAINRALTEFAGTQNPVIQLAPTLPCNQVAYQYRPGLLDDVEIEVLENASAALTAVLATFGQDASVDDERIDQELYAKALQVARLIDEICPNGQCAEETDNEPLEKQ